MPRRRRLPSYDLTELIKRIIADCQQPERLIEIYYWSAEPQLAELMRHYVALPEEARLLLHAFLALTANAPGLTAQIDANGDLILSSPCVVELAKKIAETIASPVVIH